MRMEPLEMRQMLSTTQSPEVEFDDPIIIVSGPAAPTSDSQLSTTSVTDVFGTQGVILPRQSFVLLSQQHADGSPSDQFVVRTEYDATGAPRAVVSLRPNLAEIDDSLHTLQLELRIGEMKLGEIELLIDVESQTFRQQFLADRLERASQEVSPVEAAQLQSWMNALDAQGEFSDLQELEPEEAEQKSLERLNGVAKAVGREGVLPFSDQARLGVYTALRNSAQAAKTEEQAALTAEEKEAAAANVRQVGRATLLLSDRMAADLQSTDEQVNQAAQALRDELLASGELYYTLFTGLRRNQEVIRSISGNSERVLAFVEEGSINLTPQLRVELGDQQAMVEGTIVRGVGFSSAALTADVAGDKYVAANSQEVIYNDRLSVRRTGGDNIIVSLMSIDLSSHQGKLPTQATLTLKTLADQPSANHKISAHYQTWNDPTTPFDESTYSWSQYLGISSGFRDWSGNTWDVINGDNQIDITIAARRALLLGDSNVDGEVKVAGAYGTALGDIEAFYQAVRHWDAYAAQYEDVQQVVDDLLYRNDANWDGQVTTADIAAFFSRLNTGRGNYTLNDVTDLYTNANTTGADYSRWSQNYGRVATRFSQGDGNFDGWVNDADLTVWQGSVPENHAAPTSPRLLLRIEETLPNQTLVSYGSKENPDSSLHPVVNLNYGIAEASISSFIGTDTTTNGGKLRVQYRMPEGTPSGARSLSAYQVRQTPSGPVETLLATSGTLSGSPTEWSFVPSTLTDPTSDYTIVARLSVGGVVVSERELSGGIFKDAAENWHLIGGDGKDAVTIGTNSMTITGDLNVTINSGSMPTARANFYVRTAAGYDTVHFSPAWVQSAWFSGGDQNDAFTVAGPIQQNTSLQIKDDSGLDRLDFSAAFGFQFSNFNLASAAPQDIVVNSQTAKLTLTLLDTPLELITGVPASYLSGPGYNGAPLIVDTLADLPVGLGVPDDLGLRKALAVADAISGVNTIQFASSLFSSGGQQKLRLQDIGGGTSTPDTLLVASAVTITGPGSGALAISGEDLTRIMQVNSGVAATVKDVTFLNGRVTGTNNQGAGVLNNGALTLDRVVFDRNKSSAYGGAISNSNTGTLKITDSTFTLNTASFGGGAIHSTSNSNSALVIERSTFIGNEANTGGALYLDGSDETGTASIVNSTFSGNKALAGQGGAIRNTSSAPPLTIVNSTIVANTATSSGGALAIAGNTANRFLIHNTIIADNVSTTTTTENISGNAKVGSSYNLVGFGGTGGMTAVNSNILLASGASPGLGSLGWHGGPTQTYSLTPTSVAIDAGANAKAFDSFGTLLEGDQRGVNYTRFYNDPSEPNVNGDDTIVDIGAFEYFGQFQWREAERTTLLTPPSGSAPRLEVVGDLTASGSRLLSVFNTGDSTVAVDPTALTASIAKYDFTVEKTGAFRLWMRVVAPNEGANSLWWRVNGGGWTQWEPAPGPGWRWLTVVSGITLAAGPTHTLELASGKDGIQLDKFLWTDNVNPYSAQPELLGGVDSLAVRPVIELPATVRDFHAADWTPSGSSSLPHPDFQHLAPGTTATTGLVQTNLSLGTPAMASSQSQLSGADNFRQWFHNVPTYNRTSQVISRVIEDSTRSGVYQFVGSFGAAGIADKIGTTHEFFPLDGAQFGATGTNNSEDQIWDEDETSTDRESDEINESHNYGFTTEIRADFTYVAGQTINVLEATDDLWIFIDGRLFIDLGGAHEAVGQTRSLDGFGLVAGKRYSFDLFAANRSTADDSLLVWETTISDLASATRLIEDDRLVSQLDGMTFIVPANPTTMRLNFYNLGFDGSALNGTDVRDAFEIAVLKADGTSALPTISASSDAVFNVTHGHAPVWSSAAALIDKVGSSFVGVAPVAGVTSGIVQIDISSLTPGTAIRIIPRLINNDVDNLSSVTVGTLGILGQGTFAPASGVISSPLVAASNPETPRIQSGVDFEQLVDVTRSFNVVHQHTSIDRANNANQIDQIVTRIDISKLAGAQQVRGELLFAVTEIVGQSTHTGDGTQLAKFDGRLPRAFAGLPAGTPYIRLSSLLSTANGFYTDGALAAAVELAFSHPGTTSIPNGRFDYKVALLGELNEAPAFATDPYAGFRGNAYPVDFVASLSAQPRRALEIVANGDNTLTYKPILKDPNGDHVEMVLIAGPPAVAGDSSGVNPGSTMEAVDLDHDGFAETLQWKPTAAQKGTYRIQLRAVDEFGAFDPANDQFIDIRAIEPVANRPPQFTTPPKIDAIVGTPYSYDADAFDPDDKQLYFRATNESAPLAKVQQFVIPLASLVPAGQSSATLSHLTFVNDNDAGTSHGVSQFSSIRIYETDGNGQPQILKFDPIRFAAVVGKDGGGKVRVGGDGSVVRLTENAWKQYLLDMPYKVTPKTVLAFTFASEEEGERHAIGLSTGSPTSGKWFQVYGSEGASAESANGDLSISGDVQKRYSAAWSTNFHVDSLTGKVTWTPPKEAVGQWVHVDLHVRDRELETATETKTDRQEYDVYVAADPQNAWPMITSTAVKHHDLASGFSQNAGIISVDGVPFTGPLDLDLSLGQSVTKTITVTRPPLEHPAFVPPSFGAGGALTVKNAKQTEVINYMQARGYATYEEAVTAIIARGGISGLSNFTASLQDYGRDVGEGMYKYPSEAYDANAVSSGIFVNPSPGAYGLDDYGIVLSTGSANDYGSKTTNEHAGPLGRDFNNSGAFGAYESSVKVKANEYQESLLDQITDGSRLIDLTVNEPGVGTQHFSVNLGAADQFLSHPAGPAYATHAWTFNAQHYQEGDPSYSITYSITGNSSSSPVSIDNATGAISWTPDAIDLANGKKEFFIVATVQAGTSVEIDSQKVVLPVLSGSPPALRIQSVTRPFVGFRENPVAWTVEFNRDLATNATFAVDSGAQQAGVTIDDVTSGDAQASLTWSFSNIEAYNAAGNINHYDASSLDLNFNAAAPGYVYFNVTFGSEEFPGYAAEKFVDAFGIFINGVNVAKTSDGKPFNVRNPGMIEANDVDPATTTGYSGALLRGKTELNGLLVENPGATSGYFDTVFTFKVPVKSGANKLEFVIADSGDNILDSTVYISGLSNVDPNAINLRGETSAAAPVVVDLSGAATGNVHLDVEPGETVSYDVTFTGDGAAHGVDLRFVDAANGTPYGVIPVTINNDYFYLVTAQDQDDDPLTFSLPIAPAGAVIDSVSGEINWEPPKSSGAVPYDFVVRVEDGRGGWDEQRFVVTVSPDLTNHDPTMDTIPTLTARSNVPFSYSVAADDQDDDPLKHYLTGNRPQGMSIDIHTGVITWTPPTSFTDATFAPITVTAYDGRGGVASKSFSITALKEQVYVNLQPTITPIEDASLIVGERLQFDVLAQDGNNDDLTFDLPLRPAGMSIDPDSGELVWEATFAAAGSQTVMVRVQDGQGGIATESFEITVINPNRDPEITSKPLGPAKEGVEWTYDVIVDDKDGDTISYELITPPILGLPSSVETMTIDQQGHVRWTAPAGTTGEFPVRIIVRDGKGGEDVQSFILPVTLGNARPSLTVENGSTIYEGEAWSILLEVSDPETANPFDIKVRVDDYGKSLGLATVFDELAGKWRLKWDNPPIAGKYVFWMSAIDPDGAATPVKITIPVNARPASNAAPEFLPVNIPAATANKPWSVTLTARDLKLGDLVQIQATTPPWLSAIGGALTLTETSITLSATSVPANLQSFQFVATASDNHGNSRTATITVPVIPNHKPVIVGMRVPSTPVINQPTTIELKVVDFDGDNVRFELVSPSPGVSSGLATPVAASADPRNPTVVYLPFTPLVEGQRKLTVRVIDHDGASSDATIDLDIFDPTNDPPDVSLIAPTTLFTGDELDVRVTGANPDQDGDFLTYALLDALGNRVTRIEASTHGGGSTPTGLSIDPKTGRLQWTPSPEQELSALDADYTYTVQVSDGRHLVELGPAKLRVIALPAGASAPMFVLGPANARLTVGQEIPLEFGVFDPNGGTLTITASGPLTANDGFVVGNTIVNSLNISASNNPAQPSKFFYRFTADAADVGERTLTISVTDGANPPVTYSVPLTIHSVGVFNSLPSLSLKARDVAAANETFVAQATSVDADGGTPRFALLQGTQRVTKITDPYPAPTGMSIDPVTGRITWTPSSDKIRPEEYSYTVVVDDNDLAADGETKLTDVKVRVVNRLTNEVPQITSTFSDLNILGDGSLSYPATATDKDNDPTTWSLVSGPEGASIDPATGVFKWTPSEGDAGKSFEAVIQASDPFNASSQQGISWTASVLGAAGNNPPEIYSTPPQPGKSGEVYYYLVRARDLDGERIKITAAGASVSDNGDGTAIVSLTLTNEQQTFNVTATDSRGLADEQSVSVTGGTGGVGTSGVVDTPPDIKSRPPLSVSKDSLYYHKIIVHDPDVQTGVQTSQISYSLVIRNAEGVALTLPSEAFDDQQGVVKWKPIDNLITAATVVDVVIGATQHGVTTTLSYRLQIVDPAAGNTPPVLQLENGLQAAPGQLFTYDVRANDAQNDPLTYYLVDDAGNLVSEYAGFKMTPDGRVSWQVPADANSIGQSRTFRVHVQDVNLRPADRVEPLDPDTADFTVTIQQDEPPTVSLAASTFRPTPGEVIGFTVLATDDLGTPDVRVRLEGLPTSWEPSGFKELLVGPNGVALYTVPINAPAGVAFTAQATAVDKGGNSVSSASIEFRVRDVDTGYPVIAINSPVLGDDALTVNTATPIKGRLYDIDGPNNLVFYSVTARPLDGGAPVVLKKVGNPNSQTAISDVGSAGVDGVIVNLSPLDLANGAYEIELQVQDLDGKSSSEFFSIVIESDVKLGNFALSFTDMTIPVAGFPITVQRSYDTLNAKTKGDFGYGWSLDVFSGKLEVALSDNPENNFWKNFGYQPAIKYGSAITLTLPGGETQSFTAVPVPIDDASVEGGSAGGVLGLANLFAIAFQPAPGQQTRLDLVGGGSFNYPAEFYSYLPLHMASSPFGSIQVVCDLGTEDEPGTFEFRAVSAGATSGLGIPFNPATPGDMPGLDYRLTLPDGTEYIFDSATGKLISAKDPQENRLEISDTSIRAISKNNAEMAGITITRENGLIKTIKDSAGNELNYKYNTNGELIEFRDRATPVTSPQPTSKYYYGEDAYSSLSQLTTPEKQALLLHRLTSIENAYETKVLKVGYNGDGRISKIVDGAEKSAVITYEDPDVDAHPALAGAVKIETVFDAYDNPTELVRDGSGNVLRRIERTGVDVYRVTVTAYDLDNRPEVEYQPYVANGTGRFGAVPGGTPKTTTRYTAEGRLWEVTDPLNKTTRYEYYPDGNLKSVEDPRRKKTTNEYVDGLLKRTVDATGNITEFDYLFGQLIGTRQIDDQGRSVSESYFGYDFAGRLTSSTDANNVTRRFVYDEVGNQTLSYYHWVNPASSNDVRTVVARTVYDPENREIETHQYTFNVKRDFVSADELDEPGVIADWSTFTAYDKAGRVSKMTDRFGTSTYSHYDSRGNLVESRTSTDASNIWIVVRTVYDNNGRAVEVSDPFVISNLKAPDDQDFTLSGDSVRLLNPVTLAVLSNDADYRVTQTEYDATGQVRFVRRIHGVPITLGGGSGVFTTAFVGGASTSTVETKYDDRGRVFQTKSVDDLVTEYDYDDADRQRSVTVDPANEFGLKSTTYFFYDDAGRQTRIVAQITANPPAFDPDTYNSNDYQVIDYDYDDAGRLERTLMRGANHSSEIDDVVTKTIYDANGRRKEEIDPLGRRTEYAYDPTGRLERVILPTVRDADPNSPTYDTDVNPDYFYDYDVYGNQISSRDPKGRVTTFAFDELNRQTRRVLPLGVDAGSGFVESMQYFASGTNKGLLEKTTDFEDRTTTYAYDSLGRVYTKTHVDGGVTRIVTYGYDKLNRVRQITETVNGLTEQQTTNVYDVEGRLATVTSTQGVVNYSYHPTTGRLSSMYTTGADGEHTRVNYEYDRLGRVRTVTLTKRLGVTVNEVTRYEYDRLGRLDYEVGPSGVTKDVIYDVLGRVDKIDHFVDSAANVGRWDEGSERRVAAFDYDYDLAGNRLGALESFETTGDSTFDRVQKFSWEYDRLNRLIKEGYDQDNDNAFDAGDYVDRYYFDLSSNRVRKTRDTDAAPATVEQTVNYDYDRNDRLTQETQRNGAGVVTSTTTYQYGGPANLATQQTKKTTIVGATTETHTFIYDERGRLKTSTVEKTGESTVTTGYKYDDSGIRVSQTVGTAKTSYLIDRLNPTGYAQVLEEGDAGSNGSLDLVSEIAATYTLGLDLITHATAAQAMHLLYDAHGSTRAPLNNSAQIVQDAGVLQVYTYDAYGVLLNFTTPPLTSYLYSGEQTDRAAKTGMQYLRERYYNLSTGRFSRLDPFTGNAQVPLSLHKYMYAHASPISNLDPTGRFSATEAVSVVSNIGNLISNFVQPAVRAWQLIDRVSSWVQLLQLLRSFDTISTVLRREASKILRTVPPGKQFANLLLSDVAATFEQFATDLVTEIAPTIGYAHTRRIGEAIASLHLARSRRHQLVLYLPTIEGNYKRDTHLTPLGVAIAGFSVTASWGGGGGRLWGFGFADSQRELRKRTNSYMLFRVDWHTTRDQHRLPYAKYFDAPSGRQYHWQIPANATEARG